jgi:glycosyltransferase involved in cell wall biosynthesis
MKVLIVSGMYHKPGAISAGFVHRQVCELRSQGVDVRVICPVPRIRRGTLFTNLVDTARRGIVTSEIDGVLVTHVPYWNVPHRVSAGVVAISLRRALRRFMAQLRAEFQYDIVHANHLFPIGYSAQQVANELSVPVVIGARGSDVHTNPRLNRTVARLTRKAIREGNVYAVSRGLASLVQELGPARAVPVVYNGVDTTVFHPLPQKDLLRERLGLPTQGVGIAIVSRLVREKGLFELLQAFASVRTACPTAWLAIIGDGPAEPAIRTMVAQERLETAVFLSGRRPHTEVVEWLNAADVFTLPSYNEGLPNVVLEAMACGLPVIATDVGGVSEVVTHGVTGLLIPKGQVTPLAHAITQLLDEDSRYRMGAAGLARVRMDFSWSGSVRSLLQVYDSAMRRRAPAAGHHHSAAVQPA